MAVMAADHRPLFVVHMPTLGCYVYDICIENEDTMEVFLYRGSPLVKRLPYWPLAVAAGTILGVTPQTPLVVPAAHNPMAYLPGGGELPVPPDTDRTIMLRVGDATVVRMDTVISDHSFRFEVLRPLPGGGGGWHITPLPRPPVTCLFTPLDSVSISSYFVKDTRVWISVPGEGIFSLDVDAAGTEEGAWRLEFPEEMELLEGRAVHVPELGGAIIGLTPRDRYLCAYVFDERGVPRWGRTWRETIPWECYYDGNTPSREMVSLAYMGKGRFVVSRPVDRADEYGRVTSHSNFFLALELRRRAADGELVLAKRGSLTYQGEWVHGDCRGQYFIQ